MSSRLSLSFFWMVSGRFWDGFGTVLEQFWDHLGVIVQDCSLLFRHRFLHRFFIIFLMGFGPKTVKKALAAGTILATFFGRRFWDAFLSLRDAPGTLWDPSGTLPRRSGTPLGRTRDAPGRLRDAPGRLRDPSGMLPGRSGTPLGRSHDALGPFWMHFYSKNTFF